MPDDHPLKILFVINPGSGGSRVNWTAAIEQYVEEQRIDSKTCLLAGPHDLGVLKQLIDTFSPARVIAAGGDGTVSLVAGLLLSTPVALGILPAGSANGMATELGIPPTPAEALHIAVHGHVRNSDVIRINNRFICLHLSDIGLNAKLIRNFDNGKVRGKRGYARVVLKTLWRRSRMKVYIKIDDKEIVYDAEMVVLANASRYGTGAVINPPGNLYDGLFEVVVMRRLALSELIKMWIGFRRFDPGKMVVFHTTSAILHTRRKVHFQVDGEYLGKVNDVRAEILPGRLKLIVP